jgi:hypothetical protein
MPHPDAPLDAWPPSARPIAQVQLRLEHRPDEKPVAHDISAAAAAGATLFVAADEHATVEVLDRTADGGLGAHDWVRLAERFDLPDPDDEIDIEGLAVEGDGLWIVGSHSLTRKKPKAGKPVDEEAIARLAKLKDNPNRMFLGRLPIAPAGDGRWRVADGPGEMLRIRHGRTDLTRALAEDLHLERFLKLPAKENGLDVEGLVIDGGRVGLGLRGPVINGWALVLELRVERRRGELEMDGGLRKHWLDLGGLGIRDLKRRGDDVIVLSGPTMALDGPVQLYRWRGWREPPPAEQLVQRPEHVADLPYGCGCDHPEAIAPWSEGGEDALLVVCDSPAPRRLTAQGITADVFRA